MALAPSIPKWSAEPLKPQLLDRQQFLDALGVQPLAPPAVLRVAEKCFQEAYPPGWSEEVDPVSGALYFFHGLSDEASWRHPLEKTFREVLEFVEKAIGIAVVTLAERIDTHLQQAQARASDDLEGWTGPHGGWTEDERYFYNTKTQVSSWEDPREPWQYDLHLRYALLLGFLVEQEQAAMADNTCLETMSAELTKTVSTLASTITALSSSLENSLLANTQSLPRASTPAQPQQKSLGKKMPLPPKISAAEGSKMFSMPRHQQQYQQRILQYRDGGGCSPTASSSTTVTGSSGKPPPPPADAPPRF